MTTARPSESDVVSLLMSDHRAVEIMFAELDSLRGAVNDAASERRKALAEQVVIELVRHSVAEEAEVYPRIRERIDPAEADKLIQEQSEAEEIMKRLDSLTPTSPSLKPKCSVSCLGSKLTSQKKNRPPSRR